MNGWEKRSHLLSSRDERELLAMSEPHPRTSDGYHCGCVICEAWRAVRVVPGTLCAPATQDPEKFRPGTVPYWSLHEQSSAWWSRMEPMGIRYVTVVSIVPDGASSMNIGGQHVIKDRAVVLTLEPEPQLIITSSRWLVPICGERRLINDEAEAR